MDIYSLVAANLQTKAHPAPMSARSEERYYSEQIALPRLSPRLFGSVAMMVGVILVFCFALI
jgi:hypothetical protein